MPLNQEWQTRIKAVEREFAVVQLATLRLLESARNDPTILKIDMRYRNVLDAEKTLEGTYVIRLFAEFETGLRLFWETVRDTNPRARDLIEGIAAMRIIPDDLKDNTHAVREYRNSLVHERGDEGIEPLALAVARGYLCHFFSFLPREW